MAKNTNPITKKIYGTRTWQTITWNKGQKTNIYQDIFIKKLIQGVLQKWNYLTSDIQINKYATGTQDIIFMYMPTPQGTKLGASATINHEREILQIKRVIKAIITIKFGGNYRIMMLQAPNMWSNSKMVGDYINKQLIQDPRQHKYQIERITWDFKKAGAHWGRS